MRVYIALLSLFKSYKLYVFFHIVLLSILIYILFSIKLFDKLYDNFLSYQYGFTPNIALFTDKHQNLDDIIQKISQNNIEFSYKMGAIKNLKNTSFNQNNKKSLSMNVDLMGLYFNKNIYMDIDAKNKCLIVDIKNRNKNWIFYLDKCLTNKENINIKTHYGYIAFKVSKRKGLYRLKTSNLSNKQSIILYKYLVEIINNFDNINHIGIKPPIKGYDKADTILDNNKRMLRDYLGVIFNKNSSFVPSLVSHDIYKVISWLKRENVFIDMNNSNFNHSLYVYNEFYNIMGNNIVLTRFDDNLFKGSYKQFIYFYSYDDRLLSFMEKTFRNKSNILIKKREELLNFKNDNSFFIKLFIWIFGFFICLITLFISIMSLTKFYKKFKTSLFLIRSFDYNIYIYSIYIFISLILSLMIAYISFYFTNEIINEYMKSYFYPIIKMSFRDLSEIFIIFTIILVIILFEYKEKKDLQNVH